MLVADVLLLPAASAAAAFVSDASGTSAAAQSMKLTVLLIALGADVELRSPSNPLLSILLLLVEDLRHDRVGA